MRLNVAFGHSTLSSSTTRCGLSARAGVHKDRKREEIQKIFSGDFTFIGVSLQRHTAGSRSTPTGRVALTARKANCSLRPQGLRLEVRTTTTVATAPDAGNSTRLSALI